MTRTLPPSPSLTFSVDQLSRDDSDSTPDSTTDDPPSDSSDSSSPDETSDPDTDGGVARNSAEESATEESGAAEESQSDYIINTVDSPDGVFTEYGYQPLGSAAPTELGSAVGTDSLGDIFYTIPPTDVLSAGGAAASSGFDMDTESAMASETGAPAAASSFDLGDSSSLPATVTAMTTGGGSSPSSAASAQGGTTSSAKPSGGAGVKHTEIGLGDLEDSVLGMLVLVAVGVGGGALFW